MSHLNKWYYLGALIIIALSSFAVLQSDQLRVYKNKIQRCADNKSSSVVGGLDNSTTIFNIKNEVTSSIENKLFLAHQVYSQDALGKIEESYLDIFVIDPAKNKILNTKKLSDYILSSSRTEGVGFNDSVQYNSKTREIFFSAVGYKEDLYLERLCNDLEECNFRLYKTNFYPEGPKVLFKFEFPPRNWVVNEYDNSVILSFFDHKEGIQHLKKIDAESGDVIFSKDFTIAGTNELSVSKDGKHIFQLVKNRVFNDGWTETLILRKIDSANGEAEDQEIYTGKSVDYEAMISPNNDFVFFYGDQPYVYEIETKKIVSIPSSSYNLNNRWSGDSKKIIFSSFKDSPVYYNLVTGSTEKVVGMKRSAVINQNGFVFDWGPSTDFFFYKSLGGSLSIFDLKNEQEMDLGIKIEHIGEVKGSRWY